jgi:hypothetical protein
MIEIDDVPLNWVVISIFVSIVCTTVVLVGIYICSRCYKKRMKNRSVETVGKPSFSKIDEKSNFALGDVPSDEGMTLSDEEALRHYVDEEDPYSDGDVIQLMPVEKKHED